MRRAAKRVPYRALGSMPLKGQSGTFRLLELLWNDAEATAVTNRWTDQAVPRASRLVLSVGGDVRSLEDGDSLTIGRCPPCDVVVPAAVVSRRHAKVVGRRGRFFLADVSTNGSYVLAEPSETPTFVRRDEIELKDAGRIGLGRAPDAGRRPHGFVSLHAASPTRRLRMTRGSPLLSDLNAEDVEWLLDHGREEQVIANTVLLREGELPDSLYFVLQGLVGVRISAFPDRQLATLGPGEVLGDMSFLEERPASATVAAVENSLLLRVDAGALRDALLARPGFATRFYRSFAVAASRRLRERERYYGSLLSVESSQRESKNTTGARLDAMTDQLKRTLIGAEKAALENGEIPAEQRREVREGFSQFVRALNAEIGDESGLHESVRDELGVAVQREVLPYLLLTRTAERLYAKPRGYAGDFLSIDWIYEDREDGTGRLGPFLDRCFLDEPAAAAVRNRRGLLSGLIRAQLERHAGRPVRITTMACGPAREVFDVFEELDDPRRLEVTLIDIDQQALELVEQEIGRRGLGEQIRALHGNLLYLAMGREKIDLADQDLIYSIGLIDYFNDKFVGKLMNYGHRCLRAGGDMVLGNFHPCNPDKALMDHVIEWRLIHRTQDDMNRLYASSAFGRPCTAIHMEEAGVNLFAVCTKE